MAVAKTEYLRDKLLNWLKGTAFSAAPAAVYAALFTVAPTDAYTSGSPTGTEVAGNAYSREAITLSAVTDVAGTNSYLTNSAQVTFPQATGAWGTVADIGIFDAPTGGNLLYFGLMTFAQAVVAGNQYVINANQLQIAES